MYSVNDVYDIRFELGSEKVQKRFRKNFATEKFNQYDVA